MEYLPTYISIIFGITTVLTIFLFFEATPDSKITLTILLIWLGLQSIVGLAGFYTVTDVLPPRFLLLVLPPLLTIIALFTTSKGRNFIDSLDARMLTILHIVRIPVEVVLLLLFLENTLPQLMTFEGRNFDALAGLSAPFIYYFGFIKRRISTKSVLVWNYICIALLLNIVIQGILSAPTPFQKFGFEQPNIALLHFPFVWLPCCIVPLVLFSHLICIRQIITGKVAWTVEKRNNSLVS